MKNNLIVLLAQRRMSVKELSQLTGLSTVTLYGIKAERNDNLKLDTVVRICKALGCDINDFIVKED